MRQSRAAGRAERARRWVLPLLAGLVLAACSRDDSYREPFADSRVPPNLGGPFFPPDAWTWGFIQVGDAPTQRYGVASPPVQPKAEVIILPGYGESAEVWFETARALVAAGNNVWVLEATGQGGSGRYTRRHDVGHAPGLTADVEAVRDLINVVVRPRDGVPVVVLASGTAAPIGLAAAQLPRSPITRLIISGRQDLPLAPNGFSLIPHFPTDLAAGQRAWRRPELTGMAVRQRAAAAWQIANPDLRMGGFTRGYQAAWRSLAGSATQESAQRRSQGDVIVIGPDEASARATCGRTPHCRAETSPGPLPYHLASDATRSPWLDRLLADIREPHHNR